MATVCRGPEPECSRFDYDERTLRKLILLEISFDKLNELVQSELGAMKAERERLNALVITMQEQNEKDTQRRASFADELAQNQTSTLQKMVANSSAALEMLRTEFKNMTGKLCFSWIIFGRSQMQYK